MAFGGPAGLPFVDWSLAVGSAGEGRVLRSAAGLLRRVGAVWRIGQTFAYVLEMNWQSTDWARRRKTIGDDTPIHGQ